MNRATEPGRSSRHGSISRSFALAVSFGLLTGLVEGAALLSLQQRGWLGWRIARVPVGSEILLVSPVCDLLLFLPVAALAALLARLAGAFRLQWAADSIAVVACTFLMWLDWLTLLGRLQPFAAVALALGLAAVAARQYGAHPEGAWRLARRALAPLAAMTLLAGLGTYGRDWLRERRTLARLPAPAAASPNIALVVLDTVRADHVGAYGYRRPTTPFLDSLAGQGVLFEHAYSTSSWTLPAHGSIVTGLLPHEHGATRARLDGRNRTIGEALLERGYRTAAFSANLDWFTRRHGFGRGFVAFDDFFQSPGDMLGRTIYGRIFDETVAKRLGMRPLRSRVLAEGVNRSVLRWLDRTRSSRAPFFVMLNYFDAHGPYEPPQPYRRRFSTLPSPGGLLRDAALRQRPRLTPEQLQAEIDAYDGALVYMDAQLEVLARELERRGAGDTLLIVTSDHGEAFGEHGLFTHRAALYLDEVQVPLVVRWPGHVPAGARVAAPATIAEIPATLADLTGAGGMPGTSLRALWAGSGATLQNPVQEIARMPFKEFSWVPAYSGAMRAVITPTWHYIEHETLGNELYDIVRDPQELKNVAGTPVGAPAAAELARYLARSGPLKDTAAPR